MADSLTKKLSDLSRGLTSLGSHGSRSEQFARLRSKDSADLREIMEAMPPELAEQAAQAAQPRLPPSITRGSLELEPLDADAPPSGQESNFKASGRHVLTSKCLLAADWACVQVVVRVRPALQREVSAGFQNTVAVDAAKQVITLSEDLGALARGHQEAHMVSLQCCLYVLTHSCRCDSALCCRCSRPTASSSTTCTTQEASRRRCMPRQPRTRCPRCCRCRPHTSGRQDRLILAA